MKEGQLVCITGIDTDIGKTVITGLLGKYLLSQGVAVITQKLSQTGCIGVSEDIETHRRIMGIELLNEDTAGLTCPYIFPVPCSPHLAARLAGERIEPDRIRQATKELLQRFEVVLLEGVGGLMVPLTEDLLLIDYLKTLDCRHILVSSPRLGSINHTLSAIEQMQLRGLDLAGLVYNRFADHDTKPEMLEDSKDIFRRYLRKAGFAETIVDAGDVSQGDVPDFSSLFKI